MSSIMMNPLPHIVWHELSFSRPLTMESFENILNHVGSLSSVSFIIWETRCHEGKIRHLIGCSPKSSER